MSGGGPGRRVVASVAAPVVVLGALAGFALDPAPTTSAAWSDAAAVTAVATTGTWAAPVPGGGAVVPANPVTTVTRLDWSVASAGQLCVAVTVTTTSQDPVEWRTRVEYDGLAFRGDPVMGHYVLEGDSGWVERLDDTPSAGQIEFRGAQVAWSPRRMLSLRTDDEFPSSVTFTLCNRNLPAPAYDASQTYQVTVTPPAPDPYNACVVATVAVTSPTYPFFVGWRADVDLSAAFAVRRAAGLSSGGVSLRSGGVQAVRLHDDVYRVTSTAAHTAGVRSAGGSDAAATQAFTICAG